MTTSAHRLSTRTWTVKVFLDEDEGRTHARARLVTQQSPGTPLEGVGLARRHHRDRDITEIGDELAAARALEDLAHRLRVIADADLQDAERRGLLTLDPATPSFPAEVDGIVVGVADASHGRGALAWAARQARDTHRRLDLVHVIENDGPPPGATVEIEQSPARELLTGVQQEVRAHHPDLRTRTVLSVGGAVSGLLARTSEQDLMVLGRRGRGTFAQLMLGSVAVALVARSPVPVVVVPEDWDPDAHTTGPVVVGVDPGEAHPALIEFAFAEAERRGCPLIVSHGWEWPPFLTVDPMAGPNTLDAWVLHHREAVDRALAPVRASHPTVEVEVRQRHGHPATVLLDDAAGAQLIVLGRRERRILLASGHVARRVLHYARVPVAVVPDVREDRQAR